MEKPKRALFINCHTQGIHEGKVASLGDMQQAVGGYIEVAYHLPNGDDVYVDEEGLLKDPQVFFYIEGAPNPFAGNAVIVGDVDEEGDTTDARTTVPELKAQVTFMNSIEVLAFLRERGL